MGYSEDAEKKFIQDLERKTYNEDGYILLSGLFSVEEINRTKERMRKVFLTYMKEKNLLLPGKDDVSFDELVIILFSLDFEGFLGCCQICQNLVEVYSLSCNPELIDHLESIGVKSCSLNTRPLVSFSCFSTAVTENYWKVPPHQDWPSTQGSINGVTCWVPLVNVDYDLGPLEVVKGSHLLGYIESRDDGIPIIENSENYEFESIPMNVGDVLIFSNFLIHRSGFNKNNNKIRLTTHFRYDDFSEKTFIDRKYPRHRIDKRKEGILHPGFPTKTEINAFFSNNK